MSFRSGNRRGPSNLELAIMIGNLNPNSTTRPCTQCNQDVPKTQVLLTCEKCREKKKRQKERRKERDMAVEEGRGKGPNQGFSNAPLQAVIAKQEQQTAARRASGRKDGSTTNAGSSSRSMGIVLQAILDEHQTDSSSKAMPKKKTKKAAQEEESLEGLTPRLLFEMATAKGKISSGIKRKLEEVEPNEPGTVYDVETAQKRLRGEMPMPKLEPIPQAAGSNPTREKGGKSVPRAAALSSQSSKPLLPLSRQSSNLPPPTKADSDAKPQKVQASLSGWFKPTPKSN
ncbi:hypothetical protein B0H19DRAFT_1251247 [Mycena capillaripes]|nr:hypothetical protein B0H19DRAFT_1251247 [Mycena capillaripes]